jgi:hypothetical protein
MQDLTVVTDAQTVTRRPTQRNPRSEMSCTLKADAAHPEAQMHGRGHQGCRTKLPVNDALESPPTQMVYVPGSMLHVPAAFQIVSCSSGM